MYISTLYAPGHDLQPYTQGTGGVVTALEALLNVLWTILSKINISQLQSDSFGEKSSQGEGTSCAPSLWTLKK